LTKAAPPILGRLAGRFPKKNHERGGNQKGGGVVSGGENRGFPKKRCEKGKGVLKRGEGKQKNTGWLGWCFGFRGGGGGWGK